jgi:5-methylcytosine-specific restriction endonuclease McrA
VSRVSNGAVIEYKCPRTRCRKCSENRFLETKRAGERRRKAIHGNRSTFRKRCRKYGVYYEPVSKKKILDRDKWKCQLCGCKLLDKYTKICGTRSVHPRSPTLDHIIPLSLGPEVCPGHIESNLQAACWDCNVQKGATHPDSFVAAQATRLH